MVQPDLEALVGQRVAAVPDALPPARLAEEMAERLMGSTPELGVSTMTISARDCGRPGRAG